MKQNLTLAIDEDLLHRARLVAAPSKKKTLTGMVRNTWKILLMKIKDVRLPWIGF